jgi:ectoine hydroxylase-related dioxygenase (phytanoyl-CoA dioxygenase family)
MLDYKQKTYRPDDIDGMKRGLEDDGFALIPDVLSREEVEKACLHIDKLKAIHWDRLHVGATDHFKNVFNQDAFWLKFIDWPGVVDLAEAVMGEQCHIIGESAWRSRPGHNGDGIHADQRFIDVDEELLVSGRVKLPIHLCTAHFYLSDIDEELCPTKVIPGSHKSGRDPDAGAKSWRGRELEPVLCKAGDVLFFRSEIWHTGSKNATQDRVRYLLQVHYSSRNVAQHFSPFLTWQFHPDVLAQANPRQRRLLGDHKQMAYD